MAFTYFFRDMETLRLIQERVLPELCGHRYINIWDAGCAMGPEPYSLAIMFREKMGRFQFRNLKIYATDIDRNDVFGGIIRSGIYPEEMIKRVPADLKAKYFVPSGSPGQFQVNEEIRKAIAFKKHDLLSLTPIRDGFVMILCKNVLLHFQEHERVEVVKMFHRALAKGGFFVTEKTQKLPSGLEPLFKPMTSNGQLFRKV